MTNRPKYLNLVQIRMPVTALVSILHRASGALLFLALPWLLWWWQVSLASADAFASLQAMMTHWFARLVMLGLVWSYLHHVCAGIRHLMLDVDVGTELAAARLSSKLVLGISITLTLLIGAALW